jgi:hypothetical protein
LPTDTGRSETRSEKQRTANAHQTAEKERLARGAETTTAFLKCHGSLVAQCTTSLRRRSHKYRDPSPTAQDDGEEGAAEDHGDAGGLL